MKFALFYQNSLKNSAHIFWVLLGLIIFLFSSSFATPSRHNCLRISQDVNLPPQILAITIIPGRSDFPNLSDSTITSHYIIYYSKSGANSVQLSDLNKNNIPDYVDSLANILEDAWSFYFTQHAMPLIPLSKTNKFPVFIDDLGASYYGYVASYPSITNGDNPNTTQIESQSQLSYMALQFSYDSMGGIELAAKPTIIHEFSHAIQLGVNTATSQWILEALATSFESIRYPEIHDNFQYLNAFMQGPDAPLTFFDGDPGLKEWASHQYGIWPIFKGIYDYEGGFNTLEKIHLGFGKLKSGIQNPELFLVDSLLRLNNSDLNQALRRFFIQVTRMKTTQSPWNLNFANSWTYKPIKEDAQLQYSGKTSQYSSQTNGNGYLRSRGLDVFQLSASEDFSFKLESVKGLPLEAILIQERPDSLHLQYWNTSVNLTRNVNNPTLWNKSKLLIWNTSADTTNAQYNIILDAKSNVNLIQTPQSVFKWNINQKNVEILGIASEKTLFWELYNLEGKRLFGGISPVENHRANLDLSSVVSGIYIIHTAGIRHKVFLMD